MQYEIEHLWAGDNGYFFLEKNGKVLGRLDYSGSDDNMLLESTEVNRRLRDRGLGHALVNSAIEYARRMGLKVIPLCSFAKSVFMERKTELNDVLAKG